MKRSGNIFFGSITILIALSIAVLVVVAKSKSLMALFYVFLAISVILLVVGLVQIIRWLMDRSVIKRGEKSLATLTKVPSISSGNGLWQVGKTVQIEFEYKNADGNLLKGSSVVTADFAKGLIVGEDLPILLYKNRAVIDYKSLQ